MVEHHNGIVGVRGSNPLGSTDFRTKFGASLQKGDSCGKRFAQTVWHMGCLGILQTTRNGPPFLFGHGVKEYATNGPTSAIRAGKDRS